MRLVSRMIFCSGLPGARREDLVDLRLHLLEAIEVLRRRRCRLPAGPLRRLVDHDPRMREREPAPVARRLQHDRPIEYAIPCTMIVTSIPRLTTSRMASWIARPSVTLPPALLM